MGLASRRRKYGTWEMVIEVKKSKREIEPETRSNSSFPPPGTAGTRNAVTSA
jgi:hypothetical protein